MTAAEHSTAFTPVAEAAVTVALTAAALALGTLVFGVATGVPPTALPQLVGAGLVDWRMLGWIVLVAVIAAAFRSATPRRRATLAVVAAVVTATISFGVAIGPVIVASGPGILIIAFPAILGIAAFAVCAAFGAFGAVMVLRGVSPQTRSRAVTIVGAAAIVIGGAMSLALITQYMLTYLGRSWSSDDPSAEDAGRFLLTAALASGLPLAAAIAGAIAKRRSIVILGLVATASALVLAFVFPVPRDLWSPPQSPGSELPDSYTPCYGGLDDPGCEGG